MGRKDNGDLLQTVLLNPNGHRIGVWFNLHSRMRWQECQPTPSLSVAVPSYEPTSTRQSSASVRVRSQFHRLLLRLRTLQTHRALGYCAQRYSPAAQTREAASDGSWIATHKDVGIVALSQFINMTLLVD